ncbi:DNA-processing protein DprA [Pseudomonas sp. 5P_5.1_Bac1]|uniref:DNA-processing protein DprA n=1 Tax=Pseudomonas sp. 5P_5.1_Bac1 TaxID=2971616 RepID=UPI0021C7D8B0|nr:DNA-processing protein DprA [Pseudomonas sp. 5P_5.1_Bac1]MCU1724050.1 DNA-protecting protein DprA [Pseudomonas sp. 5P_5.1_Bac1]
MMNSNTQAILLLTAYFSKPGKDSVKPLTPTEWGRFAHWLNENGKTPADLVTNDPHGLLQGWDVSKIPLERIKLLLGRGHAMALALEKWTRAGIWVLTRSDADYPRSLKHRLRNDAPPVLFGCGNPQLLNCMGISVVGSRNALEEDLHYTRRLGRSIVESGCTVVSGGAKGIDETAMLAGVENNGTVVGVLSDSLLTAAISSKWRQGLMNGNLVLVSPFYPEAGFNTGNAMARNKYIYCIGQAAVVVHSGISGGTWNGAIENLKKAWVPLWVKPNTNADAGNSQLVGKGGQWLETRTDSIHVQGLIEHNSARSSYQVSESSANDNGQPVQAEPEVKPAAVDTTSASELDFYQLFLLKMQQLDEALSVDELARTWHLPKSLLNDWLKQSVEEGRVKKLNKPVRYQFTSASATSQLT